MPTWDIIATVQNVISLILEGSQLAFFIWLATGGIVWLIRQVGFWLDVQLVNQIAKFYEYFSKILDGTLFNDEVINAVMRNVYIFIGVILFFRLVMVLLKYIVNPELVDDGKKGAQQLIKRVIIGMMGILFIPILFTTINDFQAAFLKDQVLQKVLIPEDILEETQKKAQNAGKYIGTYVLAGFFNPSEKASEASKNEYKQALKKGDMALLISNANKGGWFVAGYANTYEYSYFPILSTFVIGYVLFLVIKYCLDLVTRMLKLFLYRLLSPIAMIEYMINGADDGVFKNWKTAVISTYCMLFVRVFAMWFVVFVMTLMSGELPGDKYTNGTLLADNDYLLRAIIMVALLAFMMDLPKIVGQVFGIDLEQEGSATGLLNTIKGGAMALVGAGAAIGGAALGGIAGVAKGGMGSLNNATAKGLRDKAKGLEATNPNKAASLRRRADMLNKRADKLGTLKDTGLNSIKAAAGGALEGAAGASNLTKTAYGSYKAVGSSVKNKADQKKAQEAEEERIKREEEMLDNVKGINRSASSISRSSSSTASNTMHSHDNDLAESAIEDPVNAGKSRTEVTSVVSKQIVTEKKSDVESKYGSGCSNLKTEISASIDAGDMDAVVGRLSATLGADFSIDSSDISSQVSSALSSVSPTASSAVKANAVVDAVYSVGTTSFQGVADARAEAAVASRLGGDSDVTAHRKMSVVEDIERHTNETQVNTREIRDNVRTISTNTKDIRDDTRVTRRNIQDIRNDVQTTTRNVQKIQNDTMVTTNNVKKINNTVNQTDTTIKNIDRSVREISDKLRPTSDDGTPLDETD